jgi:DHA1 family multidrug resistance protein B-like MFS transporter
VISRFRDGVVLIAGCSMFVIGYSVISYSNNIWVLFLFMVLATIGEVTRVPVQQAYLASLPPDDARSSYMALNGLTYNGAMLISSLFVTLSAFLPTIWMSFLTLAVGMTGVGILVKILPQLDSRKAKRENTQKMEQPA